MAERILHLALEVICLITGEDYTVMKKIPEEAAGRGGNQDHVGSLIHEKICYQEILEAADQIRELLTGEVPVRCQDVSIYFSLEEWDYIEEHKDQYQDLMLEDPRTRTSPAVSSKEGTSGRRPSHHITREH
ncbi:hypothetical protein GDO81_019834 [Engystomops pustulosus]|uniref:KRAB domain-containing protein n=1 Tax=Engystomops pustulosus TaxID=76066 RepID=A0AAV6ZIL6_ENGPU|nr:hypothetical protein GDO81_019834 [Engystomops pustulosus]